MLTVLNIEQHHSTWRSFFRPYRITANVKSKNTISVLSITYHLYRGNIHFNQLETLTLGYPKTILCNPTLSLKNTSFKRFESDNLTIKLMQNFILSVLDKVDTKLSITYIDTKADYPEFIHQLIPYTQHLTIISDMPRFYENICQKSSYPNVFITNSIDSLKNANIIISVSPIHSLPHFQNKPVIFTYRQPNIPIPYTTLFRYEFPHIFSEIKPDCISQEYFLSALYSLNGIKELETYIPKTCNDGICNYSADYIAIVCKNTSAEI